MSAREAANAELVRRGLAVRAAQRTPPAPPSLAMPRIVQARDLMPGDTCLGSGAVILSRPERGLRTPSGKVELTVRYPTSGARPVTWGAYTRIKVDRPSDRVPMQPMSVNL